MASRPVRLKLLPRTTIKAKSSTRINSRIVGGTGITVEKINGIWTVSLDVNFYGLFTPGAVLYADAGGQVAGLAPAAAGKVLESGASPTWGDTTGSGNVVRATSPTLVTPALGTPSALVLTNATGLPLTTGVTGVLPVANYATGSPTGTKFVRDDGVLAVPGATTSINGQTGAIVLKYPPGGRVTLTSGIPVTASDVAGAGFIYYTPAEHDSILLNDGTNWVPTTFTELAITLDSASGHTGYHQSGKIFDLFVINDSGTIRLVSGPAWSSDTSRGTGAGTTELTTLNGVLVNANTLANARFGSASGNVVSVPANRARLVGSVRMTADGVTEDSFVKRFVSNLNNATLREMLRVDTTDSWNYSTAAWQQANANAANQLEWIHCVAGRPVAVDVIGLASNSGATLRNVAVGIGIDSTTVNSAQRIRKVSVTNAALLGCDSYYNAYPGLGYHKAAWLEWGAGADTQTFYGDAGLGINGSPPVQTGIAGRTTN